MDLYTAAVVFMALGASLTAVVALAMVRIYQRGRS